MSLILDALRKMEQEKAKKNQDKADIRPDVLRYRGNARKSSNNKGIFIAIGIVVLILIIAVLWLLLSVSKKHKAIRQQPLATNLSQQAAPAIRPPQPQAAPVQSTAPPVQSPAPPQQTSKLTVVKVIPPAQSQSPTQRTSKLTVTKVIHSAAQPAPHPKPAHVKQPEKPAPQVTASVPAGITVSGIAWQDNRRLRRAVVNGSLVSEGRLIA
ncbi:MAG: hypothetical protein FWD70_00710, partial [Desulfuromonadales bacterium]|nr:hypothetical protein [Desulfuromonadales bacterium]